MHNNPPYMMPPGGPPQAPYPPYPQMSAGMQPYSPCTPQPPMANYPPCVPTSMAGQPPMHPAYQQPPQLPGAYPRSPSRMNPHKTANLQQWLDPHMGAYSPAPSVAPSVMSNMSIYSDHNGSTMSFGSQFDMPMEEMRSPSQASIAYSENIDPQQMIPPMTTQPNSFQAVLQALPSQVLKWKEALPHHYASILPHVYQLIKELLRLQKEKDPTAEHVKAQMFPLIQLIPKMIELFHLFNVNGIPVKNQPAAYQSFQLLCFCFRYIVTFFCEKNGEDAVAREIQGEKHTKEGNKSIIILIEALRRSQNPYLLIAVSRILEWKQTAARNAGFRGSVRPQFPFMQFIVSQMKDKQKSLSELLYQLGILSTLAEGSEVTRDQLASHEDKGGLSIISVLFVDVYTRRLSPYDSGEAGNNITQEKQQAFEAKLPMYMKIFRQIVTITHYLLVAARKKEKDHRRERMLSRELYHRRVTVAIQLLETGGLHAICEFLKCAVSNTKLRLRDDVLLTMTGEILKLCCDFLPKQREEYFEFSKMVDHFRGIIGNPNIGITLAHRLKECVDQLVIQCNVPQVGILPCATHEAFAQSFYLVANYSEVVQSWCYGPEGLKWVLLWLSTLISVKYNMTTEAWVSVCKSTLDTEDTFLWLMSSMLIKQKTQIPETVYSAQFLDGYLRHIIYQLADFYRSKVLASNTHWNLYKSLFIRLMTVVPKMIRRLDVLRNSPLLLLVVDNIVQENFIAWFFRILAHVFELFSACQENRTQTTEPAMERTLQQQAAGLTEIAVECFRCIKSIWGLFDPTVEQDSSLAVEMRNRIKLLIRNTYSSYIMEWLQGVDRSNKKHFLEMLSFCETVCVDEVAVHWAKTHQQIFRDLSYNEDPDMSALAHKICSKFDQPTAAPLYETLGTAMMEIY